MIVNLRQVLEEDIKSRLTHYNYKILNPVIDQENEYLKDLLLYYLDIYRRKIEARPRQVIYSQELKSRDDQRVALIADKMEKRADLNKHLSKKIASRFSRDKK